MFARQLLETETAFSALFFSPVFVLPVAWLIYSSTLKTEAISSSETSETSAGLRGIKPHEIKLSRVEVTRDK
jgi:hypothetical protein